MLRGNSRIASATDLKRKHTPFFTNLLRQSLQIEGSNPVKTAILPHWDDANANHIASEKSSTTHKEGPMASEGLFREFYRVVKAIPRGRVANYGQVALLAGHPRAARFVGYALHSNPEPGVIPCHRVVFKDGSLASGFAFGGPDVQRRLLEDEGVAFLPDGRIDLQECQWKCFNRAELEIERQD